jgi:hypothetical protein
VPFGNKYATQIQVKKQTGNVWEPYTGWADWLTLDYDKNDPNKLEATVTIPDCSKFKITDWGLVETTGSAEYRLDIELEELVTVGQQNNECVETHTYTFDSAPTTSIWTVKVYSDGVHIQTFTYNADDGRIDPEPVRRMIENWPLWFITLLLLFAVIFFIVGLYQYRHDETRFFYKKLVR